jgi:hypothetical protein
MAARISPLTPKQRIGSEGPGAKTCQEITLPFRGGAGGPKRVHASDEQSLTGTSFAAETDA